MSEVPPRPDLPAPPPGPPTDEGRAGRPKATWRWWQVLLVYVLGLLVGAGLVGAVVGDREDGMILLVATLASQVVAGGALVVWLRVFHPTWREAMGRSLRPLRELGVGVVAGFLVRTVGVAVVGGLLVWLLRAISDQRVEVPEQLPEDLGGVRIALAILVAVVGAPLVEELFFRGCLYRAIADRHGVAAGTIVSSLLFAGSHYVPGPWQDALLLVGVMVFVGAAFALLYERRGSLLANVAAHATFNAFGLFFIVRGVT